MSLMMLKRILLITGWGVGTAALQPLQNALQHIGHTVVLLDIFNPEDDVQWQQAQQHAIDADVLMGWSLGGQFALLLAQTLWQTTGQAKKVITLATNPCFVQNQDWPFAMPQAEFLAFDQQFKLNSSATLKQFYLNICRGQPNTKQNWLTVLKTANPPEIAQLTIGLTQLKQLNLVTMLQDYPAKIHFVLAEHDALVPCQVGAEILNFASKNITIKTLNDCGHSFPMFNVEQTLQAIRPFL
ncbi:alpha/beta fold hydrolase [Acinetobacter sp. MD2]|uniref:alpha/beta fold hydrolase n=1 Tax=Acinetobacter sp. MD2 TaxID=2600066 RepID=UPI002D1F49D0|nr:alpha/beta fold hydrolase [Acinetobacter sp. MD2]MEB3767510.1 alpha/beta fold hydrolase [Acinetobacter sp. MD2]